MLICVVAFWLYLDRICIAHSYYFHVISLLTFIFFFVGCRVRICLITILDNQFCGGEKTHQSNLPVYWTLLMRIRWGRLTILFRVEPFIEPMLLNYQLQRQKQPKDRVKLQITFNILYSDIIHRMSVIFIWPETMFKLSRPYACDQITTQICNDDNME